MNKSLLFMLAAATAMSATAGPLTPGQALERAIGSGASRVAATGTQPAVAYTATDDLMRPMAYVFTQGEGSGYLVVSADDVAVPVLGYADSGSFDPDRMPANMRGWLEGYAAEIAAASAAGDYRAEAERPARAEIAPLTTTLWDQDSPYNDLCPVSNGKGCMTGCAATAAAQVMKYHQWPEKGTGTKSYTTTSLGLSVNCDFTQPLDWANMLNAYTAEAPGTEAQRQAVARLMFYVGAASGMDYSPVESGISGCEMANGLITHLGYGADLTVEQHDWYTDTDWEELIYNQLKNVGPVYYEGQGYSGGHAFVCDGYRADGYFHINWGWSGVSNGYFLLSALNPDVQGSGGNSMSYNNRQRAMVNFHKPTGNEKAAFLLTHNTSFQPMSWEVDLGSQVQFEGYFYNASSRVLTAQWGIEIGVNVVNNANGASQFLKWTSTTSWPINFGFPLITVTIPAGLADGIYTVTPAYKEEYGSPAQNMRPNLTCVNALTMTVSNGKASFRSGTSGITAIETDGTDAPVQYFNLQGMPVGANALHPGQIYIRRCGSSATKIRY